MPFPEIHRIRLLLLIFTLVLIAAHVIFGLAGFGYCSPKVEFCAIWLLVILAVITLVLFVPRGTIRRSIIRFSLVIGGLFLAISSAVVLGMPADGEIDTYPLKNDDREALEFFVQNGFHMKWTLSLGKTYCFGLFYRRETREYNLDTDHPNANLAEYVLPTYYTDSIINDHLLCIIEEESLLVDIDRRMCFPVAKKALRSLHH